MKTGIQLLDLAKVDPLLTKYRRLYLYTEMEITPVEGSRLMKEGILPKKESVRNRVLAKIVELTGLELNDLVITLVPSK